MQTGQISRHGGLVEVYFHGEALTRKCRTYRVLFGPSAVVSVSGKSPIKEGAKWRPVRSGKLRDWLERTAKEEAAKAGI